MEGLFIYLFIFFSITEGFSNKNGSIIKGMINRNGNNGGFADINDGIGIVKSSTDRNHRLI